MASHRQGPCLDRGAFGLYPSEATLARWLWNWEDRNLCKKICKKICKKYVHDDQGWKAIIVQSCATRVCGVQQCSLWQWWSIVVRHGRLSDGRSFGMLTMDNPTWMSKHGVCQSNNWQHFLHLLSCNHVYILGSPSWLPAVSKFRSSLFGMNRYRFPWRVLPTYPLQSWSSSWAWVNHAACEWCLRMMLAYTSECCPQIYRTRKICKILIMVIITCYFTKYWHYQNRMWAKIYRRVPPNHGTKDEDFSWILWSPWRSLTISGRWSWSTAANELSRRAVDKWLGLEALNKTHTSHAQGQSSRLTPKMWTDQDMKISEEREREREGEKCVFVGSMYVDEFVCVISGGMLVSPQKWG